jgi:cold-inducible RNA-binding protein
MSSSKLYVGNLSFDLDENTIRTAFAAHGTVSEVYVAMDKMSGRPRGFAFVTMGTPEEAKAAMDKLNGKELAGRAITVNEARPKEAGASRSFGGGGSGGQSAAGYGGGKGRY